MNAFNLSPEMALQRKELVEKTMSKERARLFNFIKTKVSDPGDAEDLLQDVFFQLWQGYKSIESIDKVTSWMFRVARNKIVDLYRKKKPESFSRIEGVNKVDDMPMLLSEIMSEGSATPDDVYTRELIWTAIEEVIDELPESQRDVFVWHELEGLSFKEMSAKTGYSLNTLLSRKRYAVVYMRNRLQKLYNEI